MQIALLRGFWDHLPCVMGLQKRHHAYKRTTSCSLARSQGSPREPETRGLPDLLEICDTRFMGANPTSSYITRVLVSHHLTTIGSQVQSRGRWRHAIFDDSRDRGV